MVRLPKYLKAANDQPCIACGVNDGTTVFAHYSGLYAGRLGKGTGIKAHDVCGADLCHKCHAEMDSYAKGNTDERAAQFMLYCLLTLVRRIEHGVLK